MREIREMFSDRGERYLEEADGYLLVEFGFGTPTEIAEIYRALAVRCVEQDINRVLVKPGDDDPAGEHALRDAFTMILLAGIVPDFRIALVTSEPRVEARYRVCVRDLRLANVEAKLFGNDDEAVRWLTGANKVARRAA